jgi:DNA-binding transcriptional regulator YiaG
MTANAQHCGSDLGEVADMVMTPEELKTARLAFGLTGAAMAKLLGVEDITYRRWEMALVRTYARLSFTRLRESNFR